MVKLGKRIENDIKAAGIEEFPKEACGFITKVGRKLVVVRCKNISDEPEKNFVISQNDYIKTKTTTGIYAIWHTHVNDLQPGKPSQTDIAACNMTNVDWVILDLFGNSKDDITFGKFFHVAPKIEDERYEGRPYIYGVKDCFTIAKLYYKKEFGIDISLVPNGYPEILNWQAEGKNFLVDNYDKAGFVRLSSSEEPDVGDLFLIQMSNVSDHVAIYMGDDKILHHTTGRLSKIDVYGGSYWQKHTTHILRHSDRVKK